MTAPLTENLTVRTLLFGLVDGSGAAPPGLGDSMSGLEVVAPALRDRRRLRGAVLGAIDREIGDIAEGMLDIGVLGTLIHCWSKHAELKRAAGRTLSTEDSEVVPFAGHQITSTYRPAVDLVVDGAAVGTVEFDVQLVFDITALGAVVRAGCLVELRIGGIRASASVLVHDARVVSLQCQLDPPLVMRLDPPTVLVALTSDQRR